MKAPALAFDSNEIQGYIRNWANKHHWRVAYELPEIADVTQEAGLVYANMVARYDTIETPQHCMTMFKRMFNNHMNDLSLKCSTRRRSHAEMPQAMMDDGQELPMEEQLLSVEDSVYCDMKMQQAPSEIKELVSLITHLPQEMWRLVHHAASSNTGRTKGNKLLCELTGVKDHGRKNLINSVKEYILEN